MIEQRTPQWLGEKVGALTSTRAADLMGGKQARETLMEELFLEIVDAKQERIPITRPMQKGIDDEPLAIRHYQTFVNPGAKVIETNAYVVHPESPFIADSPDVRVNDNGVVEIKNLGKKKHFHTLDKQDHDKRHMYQCKWHLMVDEQREWCDYFLFCKELPPPIQHYRHRLYREDHYLEINEMKAVAFDFIDGLKEKLKSYGFTI